MVSTWQKLDIPTPSNQAYLGVPLASRSGHERAEQLGWVARVVGWPGTYLGVVVKVLIVLPEVLQESRLEGGVAGEAWTS